MTMTKPNPPAFDPLDVPESNQSRYPEQYRAAHLLRHNRRLKSRIFCRTPYSAGFGSGCVADDGVAALAARSLLLYHGDGDARALLQRQQRRRRRRQPAPLQRGVKSLRIVADRFDVVHGLIAVIAGCPAIHVLAARSVKGVEAPGQARA